MQMPIFEKVNCFYYFQEGRKMTAASVGNGVVIETALYVPGGNGISIEHFVNTHQKLLECA